MDEVDGGEWDEWGEWAWGVVSGRKVIGIRSLIFRAEPTDFNARLISSSMRTSEGMIP